MVSTFWMLALSLLLLHQAGVDSCCREDSCEECCSDISCPRQPCDEEHCCRSVDSGSCEDDCSEISCSRQPCDEEHCCQSADYNSTTSNSTTSDSSTSCFDDPFCCCVSSSENSSLLFNLTGLDVNEADVVALVNNSAGALSRNLREQLLLGVLTLVFGEEKAGRIVDPLRDVFLAQAAVRQCASVLILQAVQSVGGVVFGDPGILQQVLDILFS